MTPHGSYSTYTNHGCRCDDCKRANAEAVAAARESRLPREAPKHGTVNAYSNYNCRCGPCRAANTARARAQALARKARQRDLG